MNGVTLRRESPWIWLALPTLAVLALYGHVIPGLVHDWSEFPSLSHGFAVPFIAAYLLWARRDRLVRLPLEPSLLGLLPLVLGLGVLVVGIRGGEPFVARISLPVILLGLTLFVAGGKVLRETWIAIGYLAFMVPLPWTALKLLMYRSRLLDAAVSSTWLGWLGVPVYRDGVMLYLPNMALEVADDCSSIPAIAALLSLGVAYTHLSPRPAVLRAVLVLATLPIAIVSNIVRITTTAAAVYYLGPWTLATFYHSFSGTVNFVFTFLLLLSLDRLLLLLWRPAR